MHVLGWGGGRGLLDQNPLVTGSLDLAAVHSVKQEIVRAAEVPSHVLYAFHRFMMISFVPSRDIPNFTLHAPFYFTLFLPHFASS